MIETLPSSPLLRCAHCQAFLSECPDREFEDWVVRCFACGAKNVIEVAIVNPPAADIVVIGWRE